MIPADVSIVIPFFQGEKFILRLVQSIVDSYHFSPVNICLEIVVVVDSPDSDIALVSAMLKQVNGLGDKIILTVTRNEKNTGVAETRMTGQRLSHGRFITFIDQDDYVGLPYFSVLNQHLSEGFDFFLMNGFIEFEAQEARRPVFYWQPAPTFNKIARVNFLITPGLLVFNRNTVTCNFRQFSEMHPGSDDWACYLDLLSNPSLRYKYIREELFHYVVHKSNYHQNKSNFIISQIRTIQHFQTKFPGNVALKIKLSSLQFRLKRHLSMIRLSSLTLTDVTGFLSVVFIELFNMHNLVWLLWRKRLAWFTKTD